MCAASYDRVVRGALARVWENVFDWEHLPWVHPESFSGVELLERGSWGWKARVQLAGEGSREATIELRADRAQSRYVSATVEGPGSGTEIWTELGARGDAHTAVRVEFWLPEPSARAGVSPEAAMQRLRSIGARLRETYVRLWDQDEAMIQERSRALERRREAPLGGAGRVREAGQILADLGPESLLRARLPLEFELAGERFRLTEHAAGWRAYSLQCPHRLGPLRCSSERAEELVCPWHGYRFDGRTGESLDGHRLALRAARLELDPATGHLLAYPAASPASQRPSSPDLNASRLD